MRRYYDPTSKTAAVRWRWRIAYALNRLPGTCWANLVSWALGSGPLIDRYGDGDVRADSTCRRDAEACGRCYCGKLTAVSTSEEIEHG